MTLIAKTLHCRAAKTATIYNAQQEKLPIRINPENIMWKYPRDYGITHQKKM